MDGYTNGAKFRFENCYFRNLFAGNQWWGGRVFYCKQYIDTIIVENCTVTGGGLIFLQQNSLCKYAYYNHNTIINSCKYWQFRRVLLRRVLGEQSVHQPELGWRRL